LTNLARGDRRDLAPKDTIKLLEKLSEILDKLRSLLIKSKIDLAPVSPIHFYLRLR